MIFNFLRKKSQVAEAEAEELEQEVEELVEMTKELTAQINHDPDWWRRTLLKETTKKGESDGCDCSVIPDHNC